MKHIKLFEAFVASQKLNEAEYTEKIPKKLIDEIVKIYSTVRVNDDYYDKLHDAGLLKGLESISNGYLTRIQIGKESINIVELNNLDAAKRSHEKWAKGPLDMSNSALIVKFEGGDGEFAIYRGMWRLTKQKAIKATTKYDANDFSTLEMSYDESTEGGPNAADLKKWQPILKAFGVKEMSDLVWLADALPDSSNFQDGSKSVKSYSLKSTGDTDQDPHDDVDFDLIEYKGLLIGDHSDDMRFSNTLVRAKDVQKWGDIYQEEGAKDSIN